MLSASFGGSDGDSEYVESTGKLPTSSVITPDLARHIREMETMYEVLVDKINAIFRPMVIFTHTNKLKITELVNANTKPIKKNQDNGATPPLVTYPSSLHSPLTDASVSLAKPLPHPHVESGDAYILTRAG